MVKPVSIIWRPVYPLAEVPTLTAFCSFTLLVAPEHDELGVKVKADPLTVHVAACAEEAASDAPIKNAHVAAATLFIPKPRLFNPTLN
jgi:hypothetical protein